MVVKAMPKVLSERHQRTLLVTINRPEVRNCVDAETAQLLFEAADWFREDDSLGIFILTGAGDVAFCSGADLRDVGGLASRPGSDESGPMGFSRITDVSKPTIAAVNGYCIAGGLELACWCDFRIAARNAQLGVLNRRWGVPLVDGGTQYLPRIVGVGNALYLIETGVLIDAEQALRMGLVQEVVPEGEALAWALKVAHTLSSYPQTALRDDRRAALEGVALPLAEGIDLERRRHAASLRDPEMIDRLRRYVAGDRPRPLRPPS
jgi:enoyl-CoA hydratase